MRKDINIESIIKGVETAMSFRTKSNRLIDEFSDNIASCHPKLSKGLYKSLLIKTDKVASEKRFDSLTWEQVFMYHALLETFPFTPDDKKANSYTRDDYDEFCFNTAKRFRGMITKNDLDEDFIKNITFDFSPRRKEGVNFRAGFNDAYEILYSGMVRYFPEKHGFLPDVAFATDKIIFPYVEFIKDGKPIFVSELSPLSAVYAEDVSQKVHGDILLPGCEIGYLTYLLSEKEDVKSITIVEEFKEVYDTFIEKLYPQFKNSHKINAVCMGMGEYFKENPDCKFDFVLLDRNRYIDSVTRYLRIFYTFRKYSKGKVLISEENMDLDGLSLMVLKRIFDIFHNPNVFKFDDCIEDFIHGYLSYERIGCEEDVYKKINPHNIKRFLNEFVY